MSNQYIIYNFRAEIQGTGSQAKWQLIVSYDEDAKRRCDASSSVKNILSKRFSTYFFHSHPFNEMFIVNGKSRCCKDTFADVRFTSLLAENI